jgi:alkanesulfonate monooxygenase SsuD/methylene tetrahydromethanopterin reductase-like flavin-dependent oxidoreductase (luciferase family)
MRFGIAQDFRNPADSGRPSPQLYSELLDQVVLAEQLGFDDVRLPEHHFTADGYNPSPLITAAAIAARTSRIRIGTFVLLLPFAHPVRVAEEAAVLDILSNGRFDLGLGQGYVQSEFTALAVPRSERGQRLEEGVTLLQRLFAEDDVHFEGRFTQVRGATLSPKPVQRPGPPLWIGARGEKAILRVARLGCNLLCTLGPDPAPMYVEALREEGRDPADFSINQIRFVYVADSEDRAWEECGPFLNEIINFYAPILAEAADVPGDTDFRSFDSFQQLRDSPIGQEAMIGSPDRIAEKLQTFTKNYNCTDLTMQTQYPGLDPRLANHSLELFAREVMPSFRDS